MDSITNFLTSILEKVLRKFRAANPKIFVAVQGVLVGLYITSVFLLDYTIEDGIFLIAEEAIRKTITFIQGLIVVVAAILGVKVPDEDPSKGPKVIETK